MLCIGLFAGESNISKTCLLSSAKFLGKLGSCAKILVPVLLLSLPEGGDTRSATHFAAI